MSSLVGLIRALTHEPFIGSEPGCCCGRLGCQSEPSRARRSAGAVRSTVREGRRDLSARPRLPSTPRRRPTTAAESRGAVPTHRLGVWTSPSARQCPPRWSRPSGSRPIRVTVRFRYQGLPARSTLSTAALGLYTSRGVSGFATTLGSQVSGVIRKEGVGGLPGHSGHRVIHFHVPPNDLPCPVDGRERSWPLSLFLSSRPRSLATCIGPGSTSPSGKISRSCFLPVSHPRFY